MKATVTKPKAGYRLSRTELRRRWQQLASDPLVAAIPFKVELNEKGAIEVSPPTTRHAFLQSFVSHELKLQRPDGTTFTECPVETDIGVRVPDVVWASPEFMQRHGTESEFRAGPDLCVEVLSADEHAAPRSVEKVAAYLAAGSLKSGVIGDGGVPEIHDGDSRIATSTLGSLAASAQA
jgi:hypothetical protein